MRYFLNPDKPDPSGLNVQGSSSKKSSGTLTFDEFYAEREEARRGDFNPKPKKKKIKLSMDKKELLPKQVEIKVALVYQDDGLFKPCRGKSKSCVSRPLVLGKIFFKVLLRNTQRFTRPLTKPSRTPYSTLTSVRFVLYQEMDIFTLCAYKEATGKEYKRLLSS